MKAVLVIDMPDHCKNCPLHDISSMEGDWLCLAAGGKWIETQRTVPEQKPKWCPLRLLPRKLTEADISWGEQRGYRGGWNNCLDEIVGETE